jgi:hypothetical protein
MTGCLAIPFRTAKVAMNEKKCRRPIRAGQAYRDAIQDDPQAQQALARTMLKLRLLAESVRAVGASQREVLDLMQDVSRALGGVWQLVRQQGLEELVGALRSEQEQVFQQLTAEIAAINDAAEVELGAHGFEPPRDLEGWEELARIVEREPGAHTIEEIYRWAIAWAKREILRCRIAHGDLPALGGSGALEADPKPPSDAGIRRDEHDPKIAWCLGKRIYLGHDTQVSRLFWLFTEPVGRACSLAEVQRAVDGMETARDLDATGEEFQRASQRVRKAIAKLRQALRENGADTHLVIVRGGDARTPEYTMVLRFGEQH